jgi:hypothetical protein
MTPELEKKLIEKYPKIFRQKDLPMTETCMCWGLDCGDGWYKIIDALCKCIQSKIDGRIHMDEIMRKNNNFGRVFAGCHWGWKSLRWWRAFVDRYKEYRRLKIPFNEVDYVIEAVQVKEKFGGLRFYITGSVHSYDDEVQGMVNLAETLSFMTCERCGNDAELKGDGWLYTLCDECEEKRNKERNRPVAKSRIKRKK